MKHLNFDLTKYNSFRLKSIAKEAYFPQSIAELENIIKLYPNIPILSGGTNVLLRPIIEKIVLLKNMPTNIKFEIDEKNLIIDVDSNVCLQKFIKIVTLDYDYTGLEELWGIPGVIGGAIVMNSGSRSSTISNNLIYVNVLTRNGKIKTYTKEQLQFKRRYSILQDINDIVLNAKFSFSTKNINNEILEDIQTYRKNFPKYPNAGGIFKNWHALKPHENQLVGLSVGGAKVSEKINVILNYNNATFEDITMLIQKIKTIVQVPLELEVKII